MDVLLGAEVGLGVVLEVEVVEEVGLEVVEGVELGVGEEVDVEFTPPVEEVLSSINGEEMR